jgi:Flp pilus assembly protein TadB
MAQQQRTSHVLQQAMHDVIHRRRKSMNHDTKHTFMMALACIIPMGFILLMPLLGIPRGYAWVAIVAMLGAHLWMMRSHNH